MYEIELKEEEEEVKRNNIQNIVYVTLRCVSVNET